VTIPLATYRLQLTPSFGFEAARERLDYFRRLGVDCLYLSPIFEARPGSAHGYDVADPTRLRSEFGGERAFTDLASDARSAGLSILVDIVPNHMAAQHANPWWWDALARGPESPHASTFDIDWSVAGGRVVLPTLGKPVEEALEAGELSVQTPEELDEPVIRYFDKRFPISPETRGQAESTPMAELLAAQHYALVYWRDSAKRRNYRRFFDIDDLVALRMDDESVFHRVHARLVELWKDDLIQGVRVDHIDGLARPRDYLDRLRRTLSEAAPDRTPWILVEKINARDEQLPEEWAADGTTGYETLNEISRLFVVPEAMETLRRDAAARGAAPDDFHALVRQSKREALDRLFPGELASLARRLAALPGSKGLTTDAAHAALRETIAWLDVYRTYAADIQPIRHEDHARLERALTGAHAEAAFDAGDDAFDALRRALYSQPEGSPKLHAFIERFEQLCGPAMAKGLEDTTLYRDAAFTALNEVGGEPVVTEHPPVSFHERIRAGIVAGPRGLTPLSTHDSKRGEEVRASLLAIAADPDGWIETLDEIEPALRPLRSQTSSGPAPSPSHEAILVQAFFGLLPPEGDPPENVADRLAAYSVKSGREAKEETKWRAVDDEYEQATRAFTRALAADEAGDEARRILLRRREALARWASAVNLIQTALRLTIPGVPDTYQGSECENRTLVDPDNRRPVDYERLANALESFDPATPRSERGAWADPQTKIRLIARLHHLRRERRDVFHAGRYEHLESTPRASIVAFAREAGSRAIVVCAPCRASALDLDRLEVERPTRADEWIDALTGERFSCEHETIRIDRPWASLPVRALIPQT